MKTMTCKQLGGACDKIFSANTFDEMVEQSKEHGMEMFAEQNAEHMQAMMKIQALMQDPEAMKAFFDGKKQEFEALAED